MGFYHHSCNNRIQANDEIRAVMVEWFLDLLHTLAKELLDEISRQCHYKHGNFFGTFPNVIHQYILNTSMLSAMYLVYCNLKQFFYLFSFLRHNLLILQK